MYKAILVSDKDSKSCQRKILTKALYNKKSISFYFQRWKLSSILGLVCIHFSPFKNECPTEYTWVTYTVKPVQVVTSNKQSLVLKGHYFVFLSRGHIS